MKTKWYVGGVTFNPLRPARFAIEADSHEHARDRGMHLFDDTGHRRELPFLREAVTTDDLNGATKYPLPETL